MGKSLPQYFKNEIVFNSQNNRLVNSLLITEKISRDSFRREFDAVLGFIIAILTVFIARCLKTAPLIKFANVEKNELFSGLQICASKNVFSCEN